MSSRICLRLYGGSDMKILHKILSYLAFWKPNTDDASSFNLKVMHGINRISILMFLAGIIFLIFKIFG